VEVGDFFLFKPASAACGLTLAGTEYRVIALQSTLKVTRETNWLRLLKNQIKFDFRPLQVSLWFDKLTNRHLQRAKISLFTAH
jgi:hypothetical protein